MPVQRTADWLEVRLRIRQNARPGIPAEIAADRACCMDPAGGGRAALRGFHAGRQDRVACLANMRQAVLAAAQGRLAAAGEWVLNEKRLADSAGLSTVHDRLGQPEQDLCMLVSDVPASLALTDGVWADE